MVTDHQKARQAVQHLASKSGLQLVNQSSESHTAMKTQLDRASGKGFDRAYITLILQEHAMEVKELELRAREEKNQEVRQWAADAVLVVMLSDPETADSEQETIPFG
jgi:putative membrane protein